MAQTIQIGITRKCNLKCKFCELADNRNNTYKDMTFLEFKEIVDKLTKGGKKTYLAFCAFGEPLMNHEIIKMLKYAKKKKCSVSLRTNGLLLNKETVKELCDNHIDSIEISMTGVTVETYKMHQGYEVNTAAVLRKVKDNLRFLVQYRNRRKLHTIIQVVCMKLPRREMADYLKLMKEIGVDIVGLQPYKIWHQESGWKNKRWIPCDYLLGENYVVDSDGTMPICCAAIQNLSIIGNIYSTGFAKIKKDFISIRNANKNYQFEQLPEICQECHSVSFSSLKDIFMWQTFNIILKDRKIDYYKTIESNANKIISVLILYLRARIKYINKKTGV